MTETLVNGGAEAAIATKLTLRYASTGARVLPAYYSDSYVSLFSGESDVVEIDYPSTKGRGTRSQHSGDMEWHAGVSGSNSTTIGSKECIRVKL